MKPIKVQVIDQLKDLRESQRAFITNEKELSKIFEKDVEALDYAIKELEKKDILERYEEDVYVRHCNECGKEMWEGYCIENGIEYYCCADCLDKNYTEEEWEELYATGDSYYIDWYDELRIYNKLKESE